MSSVYVVWSRLNRLFASNQTNSTIVLRPMKLQTDFDTISDAIKFTNERCKLFGIYHNNGVIRSCCFISGVICSTDPVDCTLISSVNHLVFLVIRFSLHEEFGNLRIALINFERIWNCRKILIWNNVTSSKCLAKRISCAFERSLRYISLQIDIRSGASYTKYNEIHAFVLSILLKRKTWKCVSNYKHSWTIVQKSIPIQF